MWIRTQNKKCLVNTDQVISIYIGRTSPALYAETMHTQQITLGEYKDKKRCQEVLKLIEDSLCIFEVLEMPGGETND